MNPPSAGVEETKSSEGVEVTKDDEASGNDWFSFLSSNEELLALFDVPCGDMSAAVAPAEHWGDFLPRGKILQLTEGDLEIRYREKLGSGGFCSVFTAYLKHPTTRQFTIGPVALKKLKMEIAKDPEAAKVAIADIRQEARIMSGLCHENILDMYGISDQTKVPDIKTFLVIDILKDTLASRLERWSKNHLHHWGKKKPTPASTVTLRLREIIFGIVEAMDYLHSKRILFRDLKPDNVGFCRSKDIVKIFDFGLAIGVSASGKCKGITGTILYMAPEVGTPEGYTFPADVYSFAILLWQVVTGKIPFEDDLDGFTGDGRALIRERRPSLQFVENQELKDLIEACWDANADKRPTFAEVRPRLRSILDNSIVLPQPAKKSHGIRQARPFRMLRGSMFTR